ncbi:MAG TPA: sigma-54-dependent Fis family transcriptional regulator [Nitrospirae bacterium]|nr:transcriptional regulatory protein ZraR [bacterium BMS3Abin10]GBE39545.1 transcriptional regulatory protein ZraR [bacterium BMS3Bbin08]HDH50317.1 sigma-54-dependent Fis family transcriptional regulator [Nitrospirota bacterium]HDK16510.1 sigma-54-dependent Fis family transcriptional regulator [Nitrospirota bacterium]HDK41162.1 sigma-54-dependent Fis family transcriptional regulator [Nitrospirota bacterium]
MEVPQETAQKLQRLRIRLEQVNHAWTVHDYEAILRFFVDIVPKVLDAERCSIFLVKPGTDTIWLKFGTALKEREIKAPREGSFVGKVISTARSLIENNAMKVPGYHQTAAKKTGFMVRNLICAPIHSTLGKRCIGAMQVLNRKGRKVFTLQDSMLLEEVARHLSMAIENIMLNEEILQVSSRLNREFEELREEEDELTQFIAESPAMKSVLETARTVSKTPVNVLIHGESGTGKEHIARLIHRRSDRGDRPFVPVNCASIPENLMESEFFGYEKGAFTGAVSTRKGRFEEARGGTLFLDEIADMPLVMQPKFLRAIQEGEGSRLGNNRVIRYNMRIISATNKDLRKQVSKGHFRDDLFFRIFSVDIFIPPLRERNEDIIPLTMFFLNKVCKHFDKKVAGFSSDVLSLFEEYPWPGNVRQLHHEIERLVALTPERERVTLENCSADILNWRQTRRLSSFTALSSQSLHDRVRELETQCINEALRKTGGNKLRASKILGISRVGLDKKIGRYAILLPTSKNR